MKEINMRSIGYFLLLFSCISSNMTQSMYFFTQEKQRYPQGYVGYHASQQYAQAVCAEQQLAPAQTQYYAQVVTQRYEEQHYVQAQYDAEQHRAQAIAQLDAQDLVIKYPKVAASINLLEPRENTAVTTLIALKNTNSLKTNQELSSSKNRDTPSDHKFILNCPRCNQKLSCKLKSDVKRNLIAHAKRKNHPLDKKEIENCMCDINEPQYNEYFTAPCPYYYQKSCNHAAKTTRKIVLKPLLLKHINLIHFQHDNSQKLVKNLKKNFDKYFISRGRTYSILNPKFVPNPSKRRKLQHSNRHDSQKKRQ